MARIEGKPLGELIKESRLITGDATGATMQILEDLQVPSPSDCTPDMCDRQYLLLKIKRNFRFMPDVKSGFLSGWEFLISNTQVEHPALPDPGGLRKQINPWRRHA